MGECTHESWQELAEKLKAKLYSGKNKYYLSKKEIIIIQEVLGAVIAGMNYQISYDICHKCNREFEE